MASYAREPRAYELMAILLPELADEHLTGAIDRVSGYIAAENGSIKEILNDSPWGRRRLAYTIRYNGHDYRDGIYVIWHFDLEPSRMNDIERELKLDTRVIRYLVVHDDPKWGSAAEREQQAQAAAAETAAPSADSRPVADVPAAESATADATDASGEPATVADSGPADTAAADKAPASEAATVETAEAATEPGAPASAPVAGASGDETTAVVEDTTGAAVEAPVDETAAEASEDTSDDT